MGGSLAYIDSPAKRIKVDDLFSVGGTVAPPLPAADEQASFLNAAAANEIKTAYLSIYAPAIDELLETSWYSTKGLIALLGNSALCQRFAASLDRSRLAVPVNDVAALNTTQSMETQLIWSLIGLPRVVHVGAPIKDEFAGTNGVSKPGSEDSQHGAGWSKASSRFTILDALLTGAVLDESPLALSPEDPAASSDETEFWRLIGDIVTSQDDEDGVAEDALTAIRAYLGRENRDMIYSTAVIRHLSVEPQDPTRSGTESTASSQDNPADQLHIAKKFIEDQMSMATNSVYQRFCGMVARSWNTLKSEP